jgi:hypothetical protein
VKDQSLAGASVAVTIESELVVADHGDRAGVVELSMVADPVYISLIDNVHGEKICDLFKVSKARCPALRQLALAVKPRSDNFAKLGALTGVARVV